MLPTYEQLHERFPLDKMTAEELARPLPPLVKIIVDCDPIGAEASAEFRTCLEKLISQIMCTSETIKDQDKLIEHLLTTVY